jgi:hypothetical protein
MVDCLLKKALRLFAWPLSCDFTKPNLAILHSPSPSAKGSKGKPILILQKMYPT